MDAWAEGPAVFAEDSRFACYRPAMVHFGVFNLHVAAWNGVVARRLARAQTQHDRAGLEAQLSQAHAWVGSEEYWLWVMGNSIWQPQRVINDAFANQAAAKLREARAAEKAVQVELEAVGVAMSLGVKGVAKLVQEVPRLVASAKALVEQGMPDQPLAR
ncbi:MAG TPA: hypothetical protein VFP68_04280 [Burkholderiaceae bacterium]|nr:hypothetical protein [Burkholderiaceae bacterium]